MVRGASKFDFYTGTAAVNKWWDNPLPDEPRRRRAPERDGLERARRHEQEERARRGQGRARGGMNFRPLFYHHHHPCTEDERSPRVRFVHLHLCATPHDAVDAVAVIKPARGLGGTKPRVRGRHQVRRFFAAGSTASATCAKPCAWSRISRRISAVTRAAARGPRNLKRPAAPVNHLHRGSALNKHDPSIDPPSTAVPGPSLSNSPANLPHLFPRPGTARRRSSDRSGRPFSRLPIFEPLPSTKIKLPHLS